MVVFQGMRGFSKIILVGFMALGIETLSAQPSTVAPLEYRNPYLEHASLAAFSIGSLALGGMLYAMQTSVTNPNIGFIRNDRSSLGTAIGAAGVTAVVAGFSYFFYSARDLRRARAWDAQVSGGVGPGGAVAVTAALSIPRL